MGTGSEPPDWFKKTAQAAVYITILILFGMICLLALGLVGSLVLKILITISRWAG